MYICTAITMNGSVGLLQCKISKKMVWSLKFTNQGLSNVATIAIVHIIRAYYVVWKVTMSKPSVS